MPCMWPNQLLRKSCQRGCHGNAVASPRLSSNAGCFALPALLQANMIHLGPALTTAARVARSCSAAAWMYIDAALQKGFCSIALFSPNYDAPGPPLRTAARLPVPAAGAPAALLNGCGQKQRRHLRLPPQAPPTPPTPSRAPPTKQTCQQTLSPMK